MPERPSDPHPVRDWAQAFAALPPEAPPPGGWQAVTARLDARRRPRWPLWLASAAVLMLAIALPWRLQPPGREATPPSPASPASADRSADRIAPNAQPADDALAQLQAESARLESLLAFARDERVSSATAAVLAGQMDDELAAIDAALVQPGLSLDAQRALWQQRVDGLRAMTGFESNRRWLAAQGTRYDAALVAVD
ncbi:hypothetical protein [Luteimonas kalidii]|uniref:DUF3106 domain-containing protein n=1 Tax=Luteimonas kalidii TaxID=3042025 RepID=A0ABT6JWX5_9GAMM|nr:hypothetical protein [Luteimonas kalidii]MDH5834646.1 hypothetical protein [Luteimonas kalidii]